jgi:hypothetical protein
MAAYKNQEIVHYPLPEVFHAGTILKNWDASKHLQFSGPNELKPHDTIDLHISLPGIHRMLSAFSELDVEGRVTQFEENNQVVIEGKSLLGMARIALGVSPNQSGTATIVKYSVSMRCGLPFPLGRIADGEAQKFFNSEIPIFAQGYKRNVEADLAESNDSFLRVAS